MAMKRIYLIAVLIISCFSAMAQVDTTRELQKNNTRGYAFKNLQGDSSMLFPTDTFRLKSTWRGIGFKGTAPYYWNGTSWQAFGSGADSAVFATVYGVDTAKQNIRNSYWGKGGNVGTTAGTHFIGTTDAVSVMFKFNSLKSGLIDSAKEEASFGYRTLQNSTGTFNTALGFKALSANTFATDNTAIGKKAMLNNTEGDGNTVVGSDALYSNTLGSDNAAFGVDALFSNLSGTNNAAFGNNSLYFNTGEFNTGIGGSSGSTITTGNDNLVVGFSAANGLTTGSNNTVLGNQSVTTTTLTNSVLIGHGVSGSVNGRMVISDSITSYKFPNIPTGVGTKAVRYNPATGLLSYADTTTGGGGSTTLSSIIAATATNDINNADYGQVWRWNSLTSGRALILTALTTTSSGTNSGILKVQRSGAHSNSSVTSYGLEVENSHTGTSSTNIAGYFSAVSGTTNYALITDGGNVGIGTSSPDSLLTVQTGIWGKRGVRFSGLSATDTTVSLIGIKSDGTAVRTAKSSLTNFYNSNGTMTGDRTVNGDNTSLVFTDFQSIEFFPTTGNGIKLNINNDSVIVLTDSGAVAIRYLKQNAGTKAVRYNPSTGLLSYADTVFSGRWKARVGSTTSSATPTINTDNVDIYKLTAQAADITSFTTNLSGTPNDGDILEIQITGTATRAITWGSAFVSSTVALPTTTSGTATLSVAVQYFTTSSYGNNKWVCVNSF